MNQQETKPECQYKMSGEFHQVDDPMANRSYVGTKNRETDQNQNQIISADKKQKSRNHSQDPADYWDRSPGEFCQVHSSHLTHNRQDNRGCPFQDMLQIHRSQNPKRHDRSEGDQEHGHRLSRRFYQVYDLYLTANRVSSHNQQQGDQSRCTQEISTEHKENFAKSTIHISVNRVVGQNQEHGDRSETKPDQRHEWNQGIIG